MGSDVVAHYGGSDDVAARIKNALIAAGTDVEHLKPADMATVDELHIGGRRATLELAERMDLGPDVHVLDLGSGIGGAARTLAETYDCRVTGIDMTRSYCSASAEISRWLRLADRVQFVCGDATNLPFAPACFDAAITIHVAMNIPNKGALHAGAKRVLRPGAIFAVYDVLQGAGGPALHPVPWAREPSSSHLATPDEMRRLLSEAGFSVLEERDSTEESLAWFRERGGQMTQSGPPVLNPGLVVGAAVPAMARNQIQNLADGRIRVATYICRA